MEIKDKQKYETCFRINGQIQLMQQTIEKLRTHQKDLENHLKSKGIKIFY